jgi:hypothetical protein
MARNVTGREIPREEKLREHVRGFGSVAHEASTIAVLLVIVALLFATALARMASVRSRPALSPLSRRDSTRGMHRRANQECSKGSAESGCAHRTGM